MMKEKILRFLTEADDFVSGQEICQNLGVSRTAVWKYINALKEDGYEIESVTRKGYRLLQSPDLITLTEVRSYLSQEEYSAPIQVFSSIDSTNEEAKRQALAGALDGSIYLADQQTAGKGRRGRSWISPKGEDLFCSILLRPEISAENASMLTLVAALSANAVCEKYSGTACQIKWPNDIVLEGKKICGILTEMSMEMGEIQYVVVGIGWNLNRMAFDEVISHMATSIKHETGRHVPRAAFFADFIRDFKARYEIFLRTQNLAPFLEEYNAHLVNVNREVKLIQNHKEKLRKALGINELGELLVADEAGQIERIFTGEVSVRGLYGYV